MFQFRRFPTYAYLIQRRLTEYCSAGFPHSEICGSKLMCSSPQLIAACHVLHRLLMPRHSPCALSSLTFVGASSRSLASLFTGKLAPFAAPPGGAAGLSCRGVCPPGQRPHRPLGDPGVERHGRGASALGRMAKYRVKGCNRHPEGACCSLFARNVH